MPFTVDDFKPKVTLWEFGYWLSLVPKPLNLPLWTCLTQSQSDAFKKTLKGQQHNKNHYCLWSVSAWETCVCVSVCVIEKRQTEGHRRGDKEKRQSARPIDEKLCPFHSSHGRIRIEMQDNTGGEIASLLSRDRIKCGHLEKKKKKKVAERIIGPGGRRRDEVRKCNEKDGHFARRPIMST